MRAIASAAEQPNRARDQVAGCGGYRDIRAAAAKIRDGLVGGIVTDQMTDLIVERGPHGHGAKGLKRGAGDGARLSAGSRLGWRS